MCCGKSRKRPKRKRSHSGLKKGNAPEPLPMIKSLEEKKEDEKTK
jgi:hypothetical protein